MRGNNRSKKKQFNPTKFILFGVSLILLCNVMPWKYFERRLKKGLTDIASFEDAMDFAKAYSSKAKVNSFERLRKFTSKYIGLDVFFILFNLLRLVLAMVLKDLVCSFLPFCNPKNKSVGRKLIHVMRSQVHPDAEESDDDENIPEEDNTDPELGMVGGIANNAFERIAKLIFGFFKAVFRKGRMYFLFVFYILRMFTVAIWAVSSIPRGILNGIISGFQKSGFDIQAAKIKKSVDSAGIKEIFFDSIAEIFDQSDDEDELGPTGAPANRDQYNSSITEDSDCDDCKICEGNLDSSMSLVKQLRSHSSSSDTTKNMADNSRAPSSDDSCAPSAGGSAMTPTRSNAKRQRKLNKHLKELLEWKVPDFDGDNNKS